MKLTWLHKGKAEGGFATQRDRRYLVKMIARQLADAGFMRLKARNLKPKHVDALVERWKSDGISTGTLKNRMSAVRWIFAKVGKPFLVARENSAYV